MKDTKREKQPSWHQRLVRLFVSVFLPWVALRKARQQLHIAALIIRNEARGGQYWQLPNGENPHMIRWADELEHDGWVIWKPYTPDSSA